MITVIMFGTSGLPDVFTHDPKTQLVGKCTDRRTQPH
jgi:hypothetical protein